MKLFKYNIKKIQCILFSCLMLVLAAGCSNEEQSGSDGDANISLSVKAASTSINTDKTLWEDRVDELRMIVFDSQSGETVFNEKLYFPNGFAAQSKAVRLRPGTYDFYFIANETVYSGDFVSALMAVSNKSDFQTDSRFTALAYNPTFLPDETSKLNRFVMSAIYNDITVVSGGSEQNPLPLSLPTGKVELIRALAKVEVIFRKKVSGSTIPANTITSVRLDNVASTLSIPPFDNYYTGGSQSSNLATLTGLDYSRDSIGAVTFYIPEFLVADGGTSYTELNINNEVFPVMTDVDRTGLTDQRRTVPAISDNSVVRNYHYQINAYLNATGGIEIRVYVQPWNTDGYEYIFQGDKEIVIPPVLPTDSSIIIPTECGKVEILSTNEILPQGLQGAYNDVVNYYDPNIGGPIIYKGEAPFYCEKKYGPGWRLINSCELMSFLAAFDVAYNVWMSNSNEGVTYNMPFYPIHFRQAAQNLLEKLTGEDLSRFVLTDNGRDPMGAEKLNVLDRYFTPGDIVIKEEDYPNGWPYTAPPNNSGLPWFYSEVAIQVKAFYYPGYITLEKKENWDKVLYGEFQRYDYGSTVSRCVRVVD